LKEAAAHVRSGGHAVVFESKNRARLVMHSPEGKADLGKWAALDLGVRVRRVKRGPLAGLSSAIVRGASVRTVRAWCTRDSVHRGARRRMKLDCKACGACCMNNRVALSRADERRLAAAGHANVTRPPYARRRDGRLVLTLAPSGRCKQLDARGLCVIYASRPDACAAFPPASEGCLFARDAEQGVFDGARD
jgi:hypothetical protein